MSALMVVSQPSEERPEEKVKRFVPIPLPMRVSSDKTIWHYTSATGLLGIIQGQELWASSPRVMNDLSEVRYGEDLLRNELKNLLDFDISKDARQFIDEAVEFDFEAAISSSSFIVSASIDSDLLNQWAHYAGDDGFAVGLSAGKQLRTVGGPSSKTTFTGKLPIIEAWFPVLYNAAEQKDTMRRLLRFIASYLTVEADNEETDSVARKSSLETARFLLQSILIQMKHPAFSDEREVRYVAALSDGEVPLFRVANGHLVPYVLVKPTIDDTDESVDSVSDFVTSVVLGPSVRSGTQEIVRKLLDTNGLTGVSIVESRAPYMATRNK